MTKSKKKTSSDIHYARRVRPELNHAKWILRITEHKDKPMPVLILKERIQPDQRTDTKNLVAPRAVLKEKGFLYGPSLTRCLPVLKTIITRVTDQADIPLEMQQYLNKKRIIFRGNLPLDDEAGYKLGLIFKLQERIKKMDRVELIARRVDRFTKEEAAYWYSRISNFTDAANRWAMAGMKIMLAGYSNDKNIEKMLDKLRLNY